jgi:hypothetical protein
MTTRFPIVYIFILSVLCMSHSGRNIATCADHNRNTSETAFMPTPDNKSIEEKSIFREAYPRAFYFRFPERVDHFDNYNHWENEFRRLQGICSKALNEELSVLNAGKCRDYFNQFAKDHPEKVVLLHFNGRSRDPRFETEKYFSGHWIYHPGCLLTHNISPSTKVIHVENGSLFKINFGLAGLSRNDDIVIVPLDDIGNKLWTQAEHATIISIDGNKLKIDRGRYGSGAGKFEAGKTYVAPHMVEGPWGGDNNHLMWYYNLSTTCPKDEKGNTCSDVLAEEIAGWFSEDGILHGFDGIQFDISPWSTRSAFGRYADINGDGVADHGIINGINTFGQGVYAFYEKLRKLLGDQKIIIADGGVDYSQRAVDLLNGMEAEGLCSWDDVYKEFSKPLSIFSYWRTHVQYPDMSYVTHKDQMEGGYLSNRERLAMGTAACLELAVNTFKRRPSDEGYFIGLPDELIKGEEKQMNWLGKPTGNLIQMAFLANDILEGKSFSHFSGSITTEGCTAFVAGTSLLVSSTGGMGPMTVTLKGIRIPSGDLTISFESMAFDSLPGFKPVIPRQIFVSLPGSESNPHTSNRVLNYTGTVVYYPCAFYFREAGDALVDIKIEIEGNGQITLKNLMLFNETQAICREFENGAVLVNPSLKPYRFDLEKLFPEKRFKRLTSTSENQEEVNDGTRVTGTVIVPPIDGLFLIRIK